MAAAPAIVRRLLPVLSCGLSVLAFAGPAETGWRQVSLPEAGGPSTGNSYEGAVTPNGRFVAFYSDAVDLTGTPGNSNNDVFVRDMKTGATDLVSRTPAGSEGNGSSAYPAISTNGRWVLFQSTASDLVEGASGKQIYVTDRATGEVSLVSVGYDGGPADGFCDVYGLSLSANGRWAFFRSDATNLVENVATSGYFQVYLRDLRSGVTTLVSRDRDDGGFGAGGTCLTGSLSSNGRFAVFACNGANLVPGGSNGREHVYRADLKKRTMARVSVDAMGALGDDNCGDPVVSNNGRWVAFYSLATNLTAEVNDPGYDTFLKDMTTGAVVRMSAPETTAGDSYSPAISASGKVVVFYSEQSGLVSGDGNDEGDVFRFDPKTGTVTRLTVNADGVQGDGYSYMFGPSLSSNGKWLAIATEASNLAGIPAMAETKYDTWLKALK